MLLEDCTKYVDTDNNFNGRDLESEHMIAALKQIQKKILNLESGEIKSPFTYLSTSTDLRNEMDKAWSIMFDWLIFKLWTLHKKILAWFSMSDDSDEGCSAACVMIWWQLEDDDGLVWLR